MEEQLPGYALGQGTDDLCEVILSRFSESQEEEHQHLCSVVGMITQELKEHDLPSTSTAYFLSACSSLDRLTTSSSMSASSSDRTFDSFLIILSLALPRIPSSLLRKKMDYVSDVILRGTRNNLQRMNTSTVAAVSCLKCVAYLLSIRSSIDWNDIAPLYEVLLGFLSDSRPKVRRQSSSSLREVLHNFKGTTALSSASEGIIKTFERFLLLAGGSQQAGEDGGTSGAREVLYVLEALKDCLPLMSVKHKSTVFSYYKRLLELRQPVVSRRISDSLNIVCLQSDSDAHPELLLDLLLLLAANASSETSADNLTFTARLLSNGMKKIYALNRQICVVKLPAVFGTMKVILASEHEEAIRAATEGLKSLLHECIDETLIKQGVDQIRARQKQASRISAPTIIEKLCVIVESLLDYQYSPVWDLVFQIVSSLFDKLGSYSSYFTKGIMKNLVDMQKLPDKEFSFRTQMHECLGAALGAMGPETFLTFLPLNLDADDLSEVNVWVFPILKKHTVGAHLGFFVETFLSLISELRGKSLKFEHQGSIESARSADALVYSLWSLLPSFCNYPLDTAECFSDLDGGLRVALTERTEARGLICSALQLLINQNKMILDGSISVNDMSCSYKRALAYYTPIVAANNLNVLKSASHGLLTHLAKIFMESSLDSGGLLLSTISDLASISDKHATKRTFTIAMRKLLEAMKIKVKNNDQSNDRLLESARIYDLAAALLPGLDDSEVDVLFSAVKTGLQDSNSHVQKKAYKVLSVVLQKSSVILQSKLEEVMQLLMDVMPVCHFSAKRHRLECLYTLIVHMSKLQDGIEQKWGDMISSFLTEVILGLKEVNKKTRNRAYEVLVQIGRAYGGEKNGGNKQNLLMFFNMVAGGLAGETPHMVSASVKGLARLTYEFSDLVSAAYGLLPSTYLLLRRTNREIIKASLGLLKVLVAKSPVEGLHLHLKSMVEGLLKWRGDVKTHFKLKVKHILEMLVRKCGLDAVKEVMPEEHMKLLTNIWKIKERNDRKMTGSETQSHLSRATTSKLSRWNHTKIFSDFDADSEEKTVLSRPSKAASLRGRQSSSSLPEDEFDQMEDEPLDLLDRSKTRSVLRSCGALKRKLESDEEPEIDADGRLVVHAEEEEGKRKKVEHLDVESSARSEAGSRVSLPANKSSKKRKTSDGGWAYSGREYASKKAGGDVKKANRYEPYAYWPLDRKMLSRRPKQRAAAKKGMVSAVKLTKKLQGKSVSAALSMKVLKFKKPKRASK